MNPKRWAQYILAAGIILLGIGILGAFLLPLQRINWGTVSWKPTTTITVTGEASVKEKNTNATFTAGVTIIKDKKDEATKEAQLKIKAITEAARLAGVKDQDIKTQSMSITQDEETYTEAGKQKHRAGQWRVTNMVEVAIPDIDTAGELASALSQAGANTLYGPNFTTDRTKEETDALLEDAVKQAQKKAEQLAQTTGKTLGGIIMIAEGTGNSRTLPEGIGGGGDIEPGSSTYTTGVTVTFALVDPPFWQNFTQTIKTMF